MCTECPEWIDTEETTWLTHHYQKHCKRAQECPCDWRYRENIESKELQSCGLTNDDGFS
jgi:hypothetical protein